jgi:hypothetical protein
MNIRHSSFLAALFLLLSLVGNAQKKYAVLVAINDYYIQKGVKGPQSLNGCVNDANSVRDLLMDKFGFSQANIDTVYNADATRENITSALKSKLDLCGPGDIMVFYYSGHGVYLKNSAEDNDPVKRGMSQAMLTSDLYNYPDHFKCFLRDVTLKEYFNKFIDKQVVLTTIFDCCYSGSLVMASRDDDGRDIRYKSVPVEDLVGQMVSGSADPMRLLDSISGGLSHPPGCKLDRKGKIRRPKDSDGDGVPDCKDRQKFTPKECFPVDSNGVGTCSIHYYVCRGLNPYESQELKALKGKSKGGQVTGTQPGKGIDPFVTVTVAEKDTIRRPVYRENSQFLFFAATTDYETAMEFRDKDKVYHSLFTLSLINAFKESPGDLPVEALLEKVRKEMKGYDQHPTLYADPARLKKPLHGK